MRKFRPKDPYNVVYLTFIYKKIGKNRPIIDESVIFHNNQKKNNSLQNSLGDFAIFNADIIKDYNAAESFFISSIEKNPYNPYWLGNYAAFLHYYKKNYKLAKKFYIRSLKIHPKDSFILYNYAILEIFEFKNYDNAEKLLRKAIRKKDNRNKYLLSYANFLFKIRKDFEAAEKIIHKIFINNPNNPIVLCCFAQLKLYQGNLQDARELIDRAFANNPPEEIELELWFYRYCHFSDWQTKAELEIETFLKKDVRTFGWGYQQNVIMAIFKGHSNPYKLETFANQISGNFKI